MFRCSFHGNLSREAHDQMSHSVVPIHQRHRTLVFGEMDVRLEIQTTAPNTFYVLG